jgi:hypothetical protein
MPTAWRTAGAVPVTKETAAADALSGDHRCSGSHRRGNRWASTLEAGVCSPAYRSDPLDTNTLLIVVLVVLLVGGGGFAYSRRGV